jgi:Zn ribbon nucleic-acid-binding protein
MAGRAICPKCSTAYTVPEQVKAPVLHVNCKKCGTIFSVRPSQLARQAATPGPYAQPQPVVTPRLYSARKKKSPVGMFLVLAPLAFVLGAGGVIGYYHLALKTEPGTPVAQTGSNPKKNGSAGSGNLPPNNGNGSAIPNDGGNNNGGNNNGGNNNGGKTGATEFGWPKTIEIVKDPEPKPEPDPMPDPTPLPKPTLPVETVESYSRAEILKRNSKHEMVLDLLQGKEVVVKRTTDSVFKWYDGSSKSGMEIEQVIRVGNAVDVKVNAATQEILEMRLDRQGPRSGELRNAKLTRIEKDTFHFLNNGKPYEVQLGQFCYLTQGIGQYLKIEKARKDLRIGKPYSLAISYEEGAFLPVLIRIHPEMIPIKTEYTLKNAILTLSEKSSDYIALVEEGRPEVVFTTIEGAKMYDEKGKNIAFRNLAKLGNRIEAKMAKSDGLDFLLSARLVSALNPDFVNEGTIRVGAAAGNPMSYQLVVGGQPSPPLRFDDKTLAIDGTGKRVPAEAMLKEGVKVNCVFRALPDFLYLEEVRIHELAETTSPATIKKAEVKVSTMNGKTSHRLKYYGKKGDMLLPIDIVETTKGFDATGNPVAAATLLREGAQVSAIVEQVNGENVLVEIRALP